MTANTLPCIAPEGVVRTHDGSDSGNAIATSGKPHILPEVFDASTSSQRVTISVTAVDGTDNRTHLRVLKRLNDALYPVVGTNAVSIRVYDHLASRKLANRAVKPRSFKLVVLWDSEKFD